jgi:P27 family predicted phage terminase small subunit
MGREKFSLWRLAEKRAKTASKRSASMPGPKPTPTHLRLLRGNPGKRPIRPEPQPAIPDNMPPPPRFLGAYAQDEWWTTGPKLYRLGLLTAADLMPFAAYCQAYDSWRTAIERFKEMAERDSVTRGLLIKTSSGDAAQNPLVGIARRAASDMVRFAGEFGMSPAARARISAGVGYEPPGGGKFDGLLA